MEPKRRSFLRNASILAGTAFLGKPMESLAFVDKTINGLTKGNAVTIYSTGNLNGCLNTNSEQLGGLTEINRLIKRQEISGLILDAGNFTGRTFPLETISRMNQTGYHAATFGAAELKQGLDKFALMLPQLDFPLVNCNYKFEHPGLTAIRPFTIIYSGKLKIGITGVGPENQLEGLSFEHPLQALNRVAGRLKTVEKCDLIICLSSLKADAPVFNNQELALKSEHVDFIIGSEEKKIAHSVKILKNELKQEVMLSYTGYHGLLLGKTTFGFNNTNMQHDFKHQYLIVGSPFKGGTLQAWRLLNQLASANA